jgi:hypothetical protein
MAESLEFRTGRASNVSRFKTFLLRLEGQTTLGGLLLHYNAEVSDLHPWFWCVGGAIAQSHILNTSSPIRPVTEEGARVPPSDLHQYRLDYDFHGPCCLCTMDKIGDTAYTESAIFVCETGKYAGEYIAACAEDFCGFMSAFLRTLCLKVPF